MEKPCYICDNSIFVEVLDNKPSMSSDGQIVDIKINKQECIKCGTVRSSDTSFLNEFYENHYQLNVANSDPYYIFQTEKMSKSEMHLEWLIKLLDIELKNINSIIEIGCGSGNLLSLFKIKNKYGVEPSKVASNFASKIANVRNISYEEINDDEKYDLILSSCVIEHTLDPNDFLKKNYKIANDNSIIIVGLPIQNEKSFDVYFLDHLHHFTITQFFYLCEKNGFIVEKYEIGYKCMTTMGYFVLRKGSKAITPLKYEQNRNFYISEIWINNLNNFLNQNKHKNIVAFGYGETSFFYQSYSKINSIVSYYIDDVKAKTEINVISILEAINNGILKNGFLILLTNPHYHHYLIDKFNTVEGLKFYSPFSNKIT